MRGEELEVRGLGVLRFRPDDLSPDRPRVVIVPGAMDRGEGFRRLARRLPDLEVVTVDRRGYGRSLAAGLATTMAAQVDDVVAVIDHLAHDPRPVVVVGHSFGGLVTMHLAAGPSTRAAAIGVWESPLPWLDDEPSGTADAVRSAATPEDAAERFMRSVIGDRLWERLPAAMEASRRAEGPALLNDLRLGSSVEAQVDLGAITVPTVVGCGQRSAERFRRAARQVLALVGDATLVEIPDANHGAHLTHPDEFATFVRATVARLAEPSVPPSGTGDTAPRR